MIAHPTAASRHGIVAQLVAAFVLMVRNRRALRELDSARLDDCGISREAYERAIDWRFWRRLEAAAPRTAPTEVAVADARDAAPARRLRGNPRTRAAGSGNTAPAGA